MRMAASNKRREHTAVGHFAAHRAQGMQHSLDPVRCVWPLNDPKAMVYRLAKSDGFL
jgi:hypothetical protein